jgi:hypothetical protein
LDLLPRRHPAAGELKVISAQTVKYQENIMSQSTIRSDLRDELRSAPVEPLLPIEKKLIVWSLGIGLALLAVLTAINYLLPAHF